MRIGIDAKWYFGGPPSGVRVIQNLIAAILKHDKVNEYCFFLDIRFRDIEFPHKDNKQVTYIYLWAGNNLLSNLFILPRIAKRQHLDVMMFQNFVSPFYRGKKIVYIFDILFKSFPQFFTKTERIYFFFIKYLARFSDRIVTLSETEKKRMVEFGYAKEERIDAIYIGVDSVFKTLKNHSLSRIEQVKAKYNLPERYLLYVGRVNKRKNIENLLQALPLINDKFIPLVIVGKEDWKQVDYTSFVENGGVRERILFTGWTDDEDLPVIYSLATVFCFPSFAEGFGLPPLEAMASGVPVVTSNVTSLPEICGKAVLYVSPENPSEMANAVNNLLENKSFYQLKASEGIEHAREFTWEQAAKKFSLTFSK